MNNDELVRKLNSVGKTVFVFNFSLFESYYSGEVSKASAMQTLVEGGVSNEAGAAIRCSNAILIFRAGREIDALNLVVESRLADDVKSQAEELIAAKSQPVGFLASASVREALSWRLATEIFRRAPKRFSIIEMHPGGGQYDCLTLWGLAESSGLVQINRAGSLLIHCDPFEEGQPWDQLILAGKSMQLVDKICAAIDLRVPDPLPKTTADTLTFRFISEFLSHTTGRLERWECRNGFCDTSGYGGGKREELFSAFPHIQPLPNSVAREAFSDDYYYWFLLKGGEPMACLDTAGRLFTLDGEIHDLYTLYKIDRRIWSLIAKTCLTLLP